MISLLTLTDIGLWIVYITIPILIFYFIYLIFTNAFRYMGFTTIEAIIIVFISFLFGFEIIISGFNISNIYLFSYEKWNVAINMGGAVIPILLSIYLTIKKKLPLWKILIGISIVTIISYFVTQPVPEKGIIALFPYWLLPGFFASFASIFLSWKNFNKAAPIAYISGTIGVLIGADFLHIWELLNFEINSPRSAVLGGAVVFDMIFITGIIAVILDSLIMYQKRKKPGIS
ncbi:MAG: hypothetical protein AYK22_06615 [Thermoplasmatales archaeon SG8-52-3]|nr:MAG: hypothetical protein AYK22_06615 [Thermoplasmatales archaeon SG8-52-3]